MSQLDFASLKNSTAISVRPWRVFLVLLATVFTAEVVIMAILPTIFSDDAFWSESLFDAIVLTLITGSVVWWFMVRPISRLSEIRAQLLRTVLTTQEEERKRIARDLHDEIGQTLTSILVGLKTAEAADDLAAMKLRLSELRTVASGAHEEVRRMARGLRPAALDALGLNAALERFITDFQLIHSVEIELDSAGLKRERYPELLEIAVYRIVQEALANSVRHGEAERIAIKLKEIGAALVLIIEDDGLGFDAGEIAIRNAAGTHVGLSSIHERAALFEGSVRIDSQPGEGTIITVEIPLQEI